MENFIEDKKRLWFCQKKNHKLLITSYKNMVLWGCRIITFREVRLRQKMGHTPVTEGSNKEIGAGSSCEPGHYAAQSLNVST